MLLNRFQAEFRNRARIELPIVEERLGLLLGGSVWRSPRVRGFAVRPLLLVGEDRHQARENLVIALKELCIRGDFRTTVEYLITLLETEAFQQNNIDTAWLDLLIAERVRSDKPDVLLAVTCGALHIADRTITAAFSGFQTALEKGQIQASNDLDNVIDVSVPR